MLFLAPLLALVGVSSAHLFLSWPPQWTGAPVSSPLEPDGSNYPCQGATPDLEPKATLKANSTSNLKITGSAAHGGGSGQVAFTLDFPPTASSIWYVAQSWEGNHPFKVAANFPADPLMSHEPIPFMVPPELPSGKIVMSWNWFNRIGNREHYMKCSTVMIESSHSDRNRITALPTAFRANSGNGCIVPENTDAIKFENPGKYLVVADGVTPTPVTCSSTKPGSSAVPSLPSSMATGKNDTISLPTPSAQPSSTPQESYTVHQPSLDAGSYDGFDSQPSTSSKQANGKNDTATLPASSSDSCVENTIICNSDGTWSQCGSGHYQLQGQVTPGMVCKDGIFSGAKVKRDVRFSEPHKRRNLYKLK